MKHVALLCIATLATSPAFSQGLGARTMEILSVVTASGGPSAALLGTVVRVSTAYDERYGDYGYALVTVRVDSLLGGSVHAASIVVAGSNAIVANTGRADGDLPFLCRFSYDSAWFAPQDRVLLVVQQARAPHDSLCNALFTRFVLEGEPNLFSGGTATFTEALEHARAHPGTALDSLYARVSREMKPTSETLPAVAAQLRTLFEDALEEEPEER